MGTNIPRTFIPHIHLPRLQNSSEVVKFPFKNSRIYVTIFGMTLIAALSVKFNRSEFETACCVLRLG